MKHAIKTVIAMRKVSKHFIGWIALVAIEELLKSKIRDKDDSIHRIDGNSDNYRELNGFLERYPQLEKDKFEDSMKNEIYMLIYVAKRLLKYGS